ncbi:MAG: RluA family pseudouridine synthase [Chitinophagaceae bacterium]|nr:MAG: RluA family pseudouridine synthase [Chitinophagaceae bacterium]
MSDTELQDENLEPGQVQDDDLYEEITIVADKGQEPLRIDKFLLNRLDKVSRNKIQNAVKAESVLVNETPVKTNYRIKPFDKITVVLYKPSREFPMEAENIPLEIVYEDQYLVVLNKQAGLVVHPGSGNYTGTLVNALMHHFGNLPDLSAQNQRPGIMHRLDKNTSGLMVIAKDEFCMSHLAKQFFDRTIKRTYQALVWGEPAEPEGKVEINIGRHKRFRKKMDVFTEEEEGKYAVTNYKLLESIGYVSVVECVLETGRTHQIRVHMKYLGNPVFNDEVYGGDRIIKGTIHSKYKQFIDNCFKICPRQALHAKSLGFYHPILKKDMFFESEIPNDMQLLIEKWKNYYKFALNQS